MAANHEGPMVTIVTQAYNTKPYLEQCISSVLSQTYSDFEYFLFDNGSTDGSSAIMDAFAERDPRIRLVRYPENQVGTPRTLEFTQKYARGKYYTVLDSDDWWEPDYLEKLIAFAEKNDLDVACTGSVFHKMATSEQDLQKMDQPLILPKEMLAEALPQYRVFFLPVWGKLIRMEHIKALPLDVPPMRGWLDTLRCFQILRYANRIGVDNSILHHYRIHKASTARQYDPNRFDSHIYLYNDLVDFLSAFGPISAQNYQYLLDIYLRGVENAADLIHDSSLSPEDKLREYHKIALHPQTQAVYQEWRGKLLPRCGSCLIRAALHAGSALEGQENEDLQSIMQSLFPRSGRAVSTTTAQLFLDDWGLYVALSQDDPETLMKNILTRIETVQDIEKYVSPIIQALAADVPRQYQIADTAFIRENYPQIYLLVWQGKKRAAMKEIRKALLQRRVGGEYGVFMQLYVALCADLLKRVPTFVIEKLKSFLPK